MKKWTKHEEELLKRIYAKAPASVIALSLSRSVASVKSRAKKLGVQRRGRSWSSQDIEQVKQLHARGWSPGAIAKRLGIKPARLYRVLANLELRWLPRISPGLKDQVRDLHASGLNDAEIACAMGKTRDQIHWIRYGSLGLGKNEESVLRARRRSAKTQREVIGQIVSGGIRALAYRRFAIENGWPEELRPREVQILNVLAERGPMTRSELSEAIGMRTDRIGSNGRPVLLCGNGKGGTYTASLMHAGWIVSANRSVKTGVQGKGRIPNLYMLSPRAIAYRERSRSCPDKKTT